jgi:hypothetical protein
MIFVVYMYEKVEVVSNLSKFWLYNYRINNSVRGLATYAFESVKQNNTVPHSQKTPIQYFNEMKSQLNNDLDPSMINLKNNNFGN